MTHFYLSALGILLLAFAFVAFPLVVQSIKTRRHSPQDSNGTAYVKNELEVSNANVIKQRIIELAQEVDEGLIDSAEKEHAIKDLKLALVDESTSEIDNQVKVNKALFLLLALPALIIGAWVYWQSNQLSGLQEYKASKLELETLRGKLAESGPESLTPDDFAKFALSIRSSLRDKPDDVQGWTYLAMVNTAIGRIEEGIAAYKKALAITPQDDALRFKFAETLMLDGNEQSLLNSRRQLEYLIEKQPNNRNNRLLMTSVAIQLQDPQLAVFHFSLIKDFMNESSPFYQTIIAELGKLGVAENEIVGPTNTKTASLVTNDTGGLSLQIKVDIAPDLSRNLPSNAFLIVFAQHSDGSTRAPLAVKKMKLDTLPLSISLDNSDAMIPALNLSSAQFVNVTARISLDEDVMPAAGEFEGKIMDIDLRSEALGVIEVVINQKL